MFQIELENKLQQQSTHAAQELAAEKEKISVLQNAYEKNQENLKQLQSDFYGKESELLATSKISRYHKNSLCY